MRKMRGKQIYVFGFIFFIFGLIFMPTINVEGIQLMKAPLILLKNDDKPFEVWVDDNYYEGGYNDNHIWGKDAFNNISDGITAVNNSGTVYVFAGTYPEDINIELKSLKLIGNVTENENNSTIIEGKVTILYHDITIKSCIIRDSKDIGIRIRVPKIDKPKPIIIQYCKIINNEGTGIYIQENQNEDDYTLTDINHNEIKNNKGSGIHLDSNSNSNIISDNKIELNARGIQIQMLSCYNKISNNKIINNSYEGILINDLANYNDIINNDIRLNTYAIYLYNLKEITISNNNIEFNDYGLYLDSCLGLYLTYNNITLNKYIGIIFKGSSLGEYKIAFNNIFANYKYGVDYDINQALYLEKNFWGNKNGAWIAYYNFYPCISFIIGGNHNLKGEIFLYRTLSVKNKINDDFNKEFNQPSNL